MARRPGTWRKRADAKPPSTCANCAYERGCWCTSPARPAPAKRGACWTTRAVCARPGKTSPSGGSTLKGRPELEALAEGIPAFRRGWRDRRRALSGVRFRSRRRLHPDAIVLDELAHDNLPGVAHAETLAGRARAARRRHFGLGAFNIAHLETAAPVAQGGARLSRSRDRSAFVS